MFKLHGSLSYHPETKEILEIISSDTCYQRVNKVIRNLCSHDYVILLIYQREHTSCTWLILIDQIYILYKLSDFQKLKNLVHSDSCKERKVVLKRAPH